MQRLRGIPGFHQLSTGQWIGLPIGQIGFAQPSSDVVVGSGNVVTLPAQIAEMVSLIDPAVDLNQQEEDRYKRKQEYQE